VTNPQQMLPQQTPGIVQPQPITLPQQGGQPAVPTYTPAVPFGGAVPGMVIPQQQVPGQPNQPPPTQPKRPGDPEGQ
jgi:hypothetical protein